ncbi:A1S_2505 family phage non-structural protein [Variovorax ginsengisoli]|uniref:Uncharacterized protein n=1 Tax=Variovorax ginsengisoli TaxID=363844 RepID=A0ABT8SC71_9BURK|nr:hypothetical protein [Variovorax ginsengisoli]MDN8617220.1 hypothetical protein [Variovorax ginsengisoli]MDO1536390.1 hypothetical protein [Variovorax ginsengisoli]
MSTPPVFVFGSNTAGRHGMGAALFAREQRGAIYGRGEGLQGNSYAIPTKGQLPDRTLVPLALPEIQRHIARFLAFAASRPDLVFEVTPIGCGLSGYKHGEIAPMFSDAPANCALPAEFLAVLTTPRARLSPPRTPAIRFPSPPNHFGALDRRDAIPAR